MCIKQKLPALENAYKILERSIMYYDSQPVGTLAAALKPGWGSLAERAFKTAISRLENDNWPEYYDKPYGKTDTPSLRLPESLVCFHTYTFA